jgi:hypothetical protein
VVTEVIGAPRKQFKIKQFKRRRTLPLPYLWEPELVLYIGAATLETSGTEETTESR